MWCFLHEKSKGAKTRKEKESHMNNSKNVGKRTDQWQITLNCSRDIDSLKSNVRDSRIDSYWRWMDDGKTNVTKTNQRAKKFKPAKHFST